MCPQQAHSVREVHRMHLKENMILGGANDPIYSFLSSTERDRLFEAR